MLLDPGFIVGAPLGVAGARLVGIAIALDPSLLKQPQAQAILAEALLGRSFYLGTTNRASGEGPPLQLLSEP